MKSETEEFWPVQDWSSMFDTGEEPIFTRRLLPWLLSGVLVLGTFGAILGAVTGIVVKETGEQVLLQILTCF